jgi:hypothetical protein
MQHSSTSAVDVCTSPPSKSNTSPAWLWGPLIRSGPVNRARPRTGTLPCGTRSNRPLRSGDRIHSSVRWRPSPSASPRSLARLVSLPDCCLCLGAEGESSSKAARERGDASKGGARTRATSYFGERPSRLPPCLLGSSHVERSFACPILIRC